MLFWFLRVEEADRDRRAEHAEFYGHLRHQLMSSLLSGDASQKKIAAAISASQALMDRESAPLKWTQLPVTPQLCLSWLIVGPLCC